jgi:hypothetical protein
MTRGPLVRIAARGPQAAIPAHPHQKKQTKIIVGKPYNGVAGGKYAKNAKLIRIFCERVYDPTSFLVAGEKARIAAHGSV